MSAHTQDATTCERHDERQAAANIRQAEPYQTPRVDTESTGGAVKQDNARPCRDIGSPQVNRRSAGPWVVRIVTMVARIVS